MFTTSVSAAVEISSLGAECNIIIRIEGRLPCEP